MLDNHNEAENEGKELVGDPRVGKRVLCLALLPTLTVYGTIQSIIRYTNCVEYWKVLTDHSMMNNGPSTNFVLSDGPELQPGDRVTYRLDEGGYWKALVLRPHYWGDQLRFVIKITSQNDTGMGQNGYEFAAHPDKLAKI